MRGLKSFFVLCALAIVPAGLQAEWTWVRDFTKGANNNQIGYLTNDVTGVWLFVAKFSPDFNSAAHDQSFLQIDSINNPLHQTTVDISEAKCTFDWTSTITITSTVTRINTPADTGIKKLILPETVNYINQLNWPDLEEIEPLFPAALATVGTSCFSYTKLRGNPVFRGQADGTIGTLAFSGLTGITNIDMSASNIRSFYQHTCFSGMTNLKEFHFPTNIATIGRDSFRGCTSLTNITPRVFTNLTSIGTDVFNGTKITGSIKFTNPGLTAIQKNAFYAVPLSSIDLSESGVTSIGDQVFYNCTSLGEVKLPETLRTIGGNAFSGCTALTNIVPFLPASVTTISPYAFQNVACTNDLVLSNPDFQFVMNPNTSQQTFYQSGISSVDFTGTTNQLIIGKEVFWRCPNLRKVVFGTGGAKFFATHAFRDAPIVEMWFRGAPPENMKYASFYYDGWTAFSTKIYRPKKSDAWDTFLANTDYTTGWVTRDLTDAEKANFSAKWPDERMAKKAVKIQDYKDENHYQYLCTWWPDGAPGMLIIVR